MNILGINYLFRYINLISGEEIGEKLLLEVCQISLIVQGLHCYLEFSNFLGSAISLKIFFKTYSEVS